MNEENSLYPDLDVLPTPDLMKRCKDLLEKVRENNYAEGEINDAQRFLHSELLLDTEEFARLTLQITYITEIQHIEELLTQRANLADALPV